MMWKKMSLKATDRTEVLPADYEATQCFSFIVAEVVTPL